ncbi:MAG TPA: RAMP superfamily CRISPR-associated protein [Chloroflexota bacterium]|nr:RAMP superfamily CRISPR-associated protein [Chloroflexota bacterium]
MTDRQRSFERTQDRWLFSGILEGTSALHVGGAPGHLLAVDTRLVRDAAGRPYLPATTLKGALRACIDRLAPVVGAERGVTSCGLSPREERCPSPTGSPAFRAVESALREFRGTPQEREQQLFSLLTEQLCSSCRLFGSPWFAGRLFFSDAAPSGDDVPVEIRDIVGVDRDSGVAREAGHYSYEVLPSDLRYTFRLEAQNLDEADQALLAVGLSEWQRGALRLGGGAGRGLGQARLSLETVQTISFGSASAQERQAYLRHGTMTEIAANAWLDTATAWLFQSRNETPGA